MLKGVNLVRVDFRLIHGQVITKWRNKVNTEKIIVVNDQLAEDEFMADIYVMAAPPDVEVSVLSIQEFVVQAKKGSLNSGNILVLFKSIEDAVAVVDKGIKFEHVQIGGLGSGAGRTSVVKGISIDKNDVLNLQKIEDSGASVTFQVTPEEARLTLDKAKKKVGDK